VRSARPGVAATNSVVSPASRSRRMSATQSATRPRISTAGWQRTFTGAGYWLLVAGCWLLVAGGWVLVAGGWLLVAGFEVPGAAGRVPAVEATVLSADWLSTRGCASSVA